MRISFRGAWNGYQQPTGHTLDAEEAQDVHIEDVGNCMCITAGCRPNWISYMTAAKMAFIMLDVLKAHSLKLQPFVFKLKPDRDTEKELLLDNADSLNVVGNALRSMVGNSLGRSLDLSKWRAQIVPNPNVGMLTDERLLGRAVVDSIVKRILWLLKYYNGSPEELVKYLKNYAYMVFPDREPEPPEIVIP